MVLELKPMGKPTTWTKTTSFGQNQGHVWSSDSSLWGNQILRGKTTSFGQNQGLVWSSNSSLWGNQIHRSKTTSFGQNQGLVWSSNSNLWGNQLLGQKLQGLDRTKALYGPRTQASGETNYLDKNHKFWTEPRPCMVLGLKPLGKSNT